MQDVLETILENAGLELSAHEVMRQELDNATRLDRLVPIHEHLCQLDADQSSLNNATDAAAVLHARVERLTARAVRRTGHQPAWYRPVPRDLLVEIAAYRERYGIKSGGFLGESPSAEAFAQAAHFRRLSTRVREGEPLVDLAQPEALTSNSRIAVTSREAGASNRCP
jgi:hypothetical protein